MRRRFHLLPAVLGTLLLASPLASVADEKETKELDATRTGVQKVDENRVPDSVREGIEELRQQSAEGRDAAVEAARQVMADLRAAADSASKRLATMGDEAARQWREVNAAVEENLKDAEMRLEELRAAAADRWNEARSALADAMERAADALEKEPEKESKRQG